MRGVFLFEKYWGPLPLLPSPRPRLTIIRGAEEKLPLTENYPPFSNLSINKKLVG